MGELVFGCDVCQEVCPWNVKFSRDVTDPELQPVPGMATVDPADLVALDDEQFRARFGHTPVTRAKRRGLVRNTVVALGNRGRAGDAEALARALHDGEPQVRQHAVWALGQIARSRIGDG